VPEGCAACAGVRGVPEGCAACAGVRGVPEGCAACAGVRGVPEGCAGARGHSAGCHSPTPRRCIAPSGRGATRLRKGR
jgi:hypothetical protein